MPAYSSDTIVAAATPPGKGGIGIVRISGPDAEVLAELMLGTVPEARHATNVTIGDFFGNKLDHAIALFFPGTASFTGEPVLELHGHGGPVVVQSIIDTAVSHGARRAEPGEFSKRAFLNGKLDLAQAEAIADLIDSGTSQAARAALRSLSGSFSVAVTSLQERLLNLRMHVEAAIDFPEEEIDFLADDELLKKIDQCAAAFTELQKQTAIGRLLRDGLQLVIVGQPNAGKSSLLNQLSGQDAAIVTEIAGTTRDILRERIEIDGLSVELVDTAGIRDNPDRIEAEGIRRARAALKKADGVLWIQDANIDYAADLEEKFPPEIPVIILRNKIDLTGDEPGPVPEFPHVLNISAKTGAGVAELREAIRKLAGYQDLGEGAFTARRRHVEAITRALEHFQRGREALSNNRAGELLAEDLRESHKALGEITGAFTSDDLLGKIFSSFCIGK